MVDAIHQRLFLPDDAEDWWANVPRGAYDVWLGWGGGVRLRLGELRTHPSMFRYAPELAPPDADVKEEEVAGGAERFDRLFGKALTRAGWQLPDVDPDAFWSIVRLRREPEARIEFILDTNAMVEGVGHWLAALFAERCDLVVTAVSLRELQDQHGGAKLGAPLRKPRSDNQKKDAFEKDVLGRRQTYLAAMRFRELTGFDRILWRELELEDASLMLSRGGLDKTDRKTSEADTAMLREVRRSIRDRVRGLTRFFVTGDVALSRRAATELPEGSLIAGRVRDLVRGRIYTPVVWWPAGADQGSSLAGHTPMRLVWELLAVADELELRSKDDPERAWVFKAFDPEMWPSDYLSPWIDCTGTPLEEPASEARGQGVVEAPIEPAPPVAPLITMGDPERVPRPPPIEGALDARLFVEVSVPDVEPLEANLRIGAEPLLDALSSLVGSGTTRPSEQISPETSRHLTRLIEGLGLANFPRRELLQAAWAAGDRETVSRLLSPYRTYAEQIEPGLAPTARPGKSVGLARALAARLGQGMMLGDAWLPGGANPKMADVRAAILSDLEARKALTMYDLLTRIFLGHLAVSPVRAMSAWDRMEEAHVFDGIELRQGGDAPSEHHLQRVAKLSMDGWTLEDVPLDKFRGYRDLVMSRSRA